MCGVSESLFTKPTEGNKQMNALVCRLAGRGQHRLSASPHHERLSQALGEWERVRNLPDDADEKMYAALQLESATKAAEKARQEAARPRNPDGTYAGFDSGYRGRRPFQPAATQETANQLFARALEASAQETRESRDDPGTTVIVP
jgi:hypothetical protein